MTPERIAELKRLCEAADVGPWLYSKKRGCVDTGQLNTVENAVYDKEEILCSPSNGHFIAAAREAVPELLREVERLEREKRNTDREANLCIEAAHDADARAGALRSERDALRAEVERLRKDASGYTREQGAVNYATIRHALASLSGMDAMAVVTMEHIERIRARVAELEGALRELDPANPRRTDCNERKCGSCSTCVARAALAGKEGG